jgi:hypothetical protein
MKQSTPSKTVQICFKPATLRLLAQLSTKTGLRRNNVIRYAIARLAEREGIPVQTSKGRAALRKASAR